MQPNLFLAYPISPAFQEALNRANPALLAMFTQGRPDYLEAIEQGGDNYLGKWVGDSCDLATLEQLQLNVKSLLARLAPDYDYNSSEFVVLAR